MMGLGQSGRVTAVVGFTPIAVVAATSPARARVGVSDAQATSGVASWTDGHGDCGDPGVGGGGNGTGYIATFNINTEVVVKNTSMTVTFVGYNGKAFFSPVRGRLHSNGRFALHGSERQADEDYEFRGRLKRTQLTGTFNRLAHFIGQGTSGPRCTATWNVAVKLSGPAPTRPKTQEKPDKKKTKTTSRSSTTTAPTSTAPTTTAPTTTAPTTTAPTTTTPSAVDQRICPSEITDGLFEPSQGVWQDDRSFEDRAGKELSRTGPTSYNAEIPMVVGRPTVLVGVDHVAGERAVRQRDTITLSGVTTGTRPVAVAMLFTMHAPAEGSFEVDTVRPKQLEVGAPCGAEHRFTLSVDATTGLPQHRTFTFAFAAHYQIEAKIRVTDPFARGIGIDGSVVVTGGVVEEPHLNVVVVPVRLGLESPSDADNPTATAIDPAKVAREARLHLAELFPLPPDGVSAFVRKRELDLRDEHLDSMSFDAAESLLEQRLEPYVKGADALPGVSRVVAVLSARDTQALPLRDHGAQAYSQHLVVGRSEALEQVTVLAHEITHTIPFHPAWTDTDMLRDCGKSFHNRKSSQKLAHGIRLRDGEKPVRQRLDVGSIMSPGDWVDQCTYKHLVDGLIQTS